MASVTQFPDLNDKESKLLQAAADERSADLRWLTTISGGKSGAKLYRVLLGPRQCILKIDKLRHVGSDKLTEADRCRLAQEVYSAPLQARIIGLIDEPTCNKKFDRQVMFFDIAGRSFERVVTASQLGTSELVTVAAKVMDDLLQDWRTSSMGKSAVLLPLELLNTWAGERLGFWKSNAQEVMEQDCGTPLSIPGVAIDGSVYPNPLSYLYDVQKWQATRQIQGWKGPLHGDLNLNNILAAAPVSGMSDYYLIDFASFQPDAYFFADLLFLDISCLINEADKLSPKLAHSEELLGFAASCAHCFADRQYDNVAFPTIASAMSAIRKPLVAFIGAMEGAVGDSDDLRLVLHLAGVAAGLRLVNTKALSAVQHRLALAYAAGHMKAVTTSLNMERPGRSAQISTTEKDVSNLGTGDKMYERDRLLQALDNFASGYLSIAVLGEIGRVSPELHNFGKMSWDVVIDFDPDTRSGGMYDICRATIGRARSLEIWSIEDEVSLTLGNVTRWLAARGLSDRSSEAAASDPRSWHKRYGRLLNNFVADIARHLPVLPVKVFFFGDTDSYINATFWTINQHLGERASYYLISQKDVALQAEVEHIQLSIRDFAETLQEYGPSSDSDLEGVDVPAFGGQKVHIETNLWRTLESEVELLHLDIERASKAESESTVDFYRGRQITWHELMGQLDVPRETRYRQVIDKVRNDLEQRSTTRVTIFHSPGAGGTTLGRRIIYELHKEYPTVVLRSISDVTTEKFRALYNLTHHSILALVDSSSVELQQVDRLYRVLSSQNIPVVMLILQRRLMTPAGSDRSFWLPELLTNNEADLFVQRYSKVVPDAARGAALRNVTPRIPFLYGLTAFESDYSNLASYVSARMPANDSEKRLLMYASMCYYYAQQLIRPQLFASLLDLSPRTLVNFKTHLSPHACSLLISERDGLWKPLHPLVAHEIMLQVSGAPDKEGLGNQLAKWACALIEQLVLVFRSLGTTEADEIDDFIRYVFIERDEQEPSLSARHYARMIENMPKEGRRIVFETLADQFPKNAHYRAQLGRFIWQTDRDYRKALENIDKALELNQRQSKKDDPVLYHMRGMALREWAYDCMAMIENDVLDGRTPDKDVVAEMWSKFNESVVAFCRCREIDPSQEHAYVSAIQGYVRAVQYGLRVSRRHSYADFLRLPSAQPYLKFIDEAEILLNIAIQRFYGGQPIQSSDRLQMCQNDILEFYGDFKAVLQGWQNLLATATENKTGIRRNIAMAYVRQNGSDWDKMPQREIARIAELMEENLLYEPSNELNTRLWLQAYRRAQGASIDLAISKLVEWTRMPDSSTDAFYYLYILHSIKAIEHAAASRFSAERALEECRRRAYDRLYRSRSFEWLGKGTGVGRLLHYSSLGAWSGTSEFYEKTDLLSREKGTIVKYDPDQQQSGVIQLASGLRVFFVPSHITRQTGLLRLNDKVEFFLGFSYDGLRAWSVTAL